MEKKNLIKAIAYVLAALGSALLIAFGLSSCQVTRSITNEAKSIQRGDTSVVIQTKTIETYQGKKQ